MTKQPSSGTTRWYPTTEQLKDPRRFRDEVLTHPIARAGFEKDMFALRNAQATELGFKNTQGRKLQDAQKAESRYQDLLKDHNLLELLQSSKIKDNKIYLYSEQDKVH